MLIQESDRGLIGTVPHRPEALSTARPRSVISPRLVRVGAAILGVVIAGAVFFLSDQPEPKVPLAVDPVGEPDSEPVGSPVHPTEEPVHIPPLPVDPVEQKLLGIGTMVGDFVTRQEAYPSGTPSGDTARSWIAQLAETHLPGPRPHWEKGWDAPINDEFVRRRFPAMENPEVAQKSGEDNYPATHFVGVSGVGVDAADLPRNHPRAGIFTNGQGTRPEDVRDGLSNTILVAGVESRLGSWARPGDATVRSFTREPYLHGPDGFGTGQADSMQVLMADGSVKTLNSKADPVVVRRLAAMADGMSLDPQVAGDPLTSMPTAPKGPGEQTPLAQSDPPIEVELTPELPVIDLKPRLAQKIASFEQIRPVPLEQVLRDLQELLGTPLDISDFPEETRLRPVSLKLQNATVGEILEQVCEAGGVRVAVKEGEISIFPPAKMD
ncbi:hypothetical protein SH661x_000140 [Planctomicrobium sp. SH661]|uniref:hypothetical protein n=1 Tax=Planctomicrobium sp. SH661 TaxID=3448124 RepID=UPI003F5BA789